MKNRKTDQSQQKRVFVCLVWRAITSNLWPVSSDLWHWPSGSYREAGVGWSLVWQTADEGWSPAEFMTPKWERVTTVPCPCPHFYHHSSGVGVFLSQLGVSRERRSSRCRWGGGHVALCDRPFDIRLLYIWGILFIWNIIVKPLTGFIMQIPQLPDYQVFSENVGKYHFWIWKSEISYNILLINVPCKQCAKFNPSFLQLYLFPYNLKTMFQIHIRFKVFLFVNGTLQ